MVRTPQPFTVGAAAGLFAVATILLAVVTGPGPIRALRLIGGGIGLVAVILAFVPIAQLVRYGRRRPGGTYLDTTALVDRGLFQIVRHPQYLAYLLFMCAFALLAQSLPVILLAAAASVLLYAAAVLEERECVEKWGGAYREYARQVPRMNLPLGVIRRLRRRR